MKTATKKNHADAHSRAVTRLLGKLLGNVIREQYGLDAKNRKRGESDFALVEEIRRLSIGVHRSSPNGSPLAARLSKLDQRQEVLLIRAFAIFSHLANVADDHIARCEKGPGPLQELESYARVNSRRVKSYLSDALLVPVLTAHPTEVRRKSILDRETAIGALLMRRENANPATGEDIDIDAALKREIRILWQTRMMRPIRIHVTDEIENAVAVFARTFLPELPKVKLRLAQTFGLNGEIRPFLKAGSWVGGDRDGNPFVSAATLEYAVRRQSETVFDYYLNEVHQLGTELTLCDAYVSVSDELRKLAASPEHSSIHQRDEPYRRALTTVYARLAATRKKLIGAGPARKPNWEAEPYAGAEAFAADLKTIADSLIANGDADVAEGRVLELCEAAAAFGFHLAAVDLRQNSSVHEKALDELFRGAGAATDYAGLPEAERVALLL